VTVELVAMVPMLAALTVALAGVVLVAGDQVLVTAAAREGARAAAAGSDPAAAATAARAALPGRGDHADVQVERLAPDQVRVRVRLPARLVPGTSLVLSGVAVAAVEPGLPLGLDVSAGPDHPKPKAGAAPPAGTSSGDQPFGPAVTPPSGPEADPSRPPGRVR
jgi:hypothetical protein